MNKAARDNIRSKHVQAICDAGQCLHCGVWSDEHPNIIDELGNIIESPCLDENDEETGKYLYLIPDAYCTYCNESDESSSWPCEVIMVLDAYEALLTQCGEQL